jgi:hypothetical protein
VIVTAHDLLMAYDQQLRADAETVGALALTPLGPLLLVTLAGGRGFVTYRDLDCAGAEEIPSLVGQALHYYRQDPAIAWVEWKVRGHDRAPGLHQALLDHGFEPDEPESIMIGHAWMLDVQVPLPAGVELRQVTEHEDVLAMTSMQDVVFGSTWACGLVGLWACVWACGLVGLWACGLGGDRTHDRGIMSPLL